MKNSKTGRPARRTLRSAREPGRTQTSVAARSTAARETDDPTIRRQAALLDLAHDSIIVCAFDHTIQFWNRGAERLYGWKNSEAVGQNAHRLLKTKFPKPLAEIESELLSNHRWRGELIHARRDGTTANIAARWSLQRDERDAPVAILQIGNDVTREKESELERSRLYEEADKKREEAEAFAEWIRDLATSLDLDHVFARLLDKVCALVEIDRAFIAMLEQDGKTVKIRAHKHYGQGLVPELIFFKGQGISGKVLETGKPIATDNYCADDRFSHEFDHLVRATGTKVHAAIPINHAGTTLGVLLVSRLTNRSFTAEDIRLLTRIADAANLAWRQSLLYRQATDRAEALMRLWELGLSLRQSLSFPDTLERVVRTAKTMLRAQTARLRLWDPDTKRLNLAAELSDRIFPIRKSLRLGEGISGSTAASRRSGIVNDYQTSQGRQPGVPTTAVMTTPILIEDRLIGVLGVGTTEPRRMFGTEDLQLLELLSQAAAIALENAKLFDEIRESRARLRALSLRLVQAQESERRHLARELHDEIGQTLTALKLTLEMSQHGPGGGAETHLQDAEAMIDELMRRVRQMSLDLRPSMLDDLGLLPTLVWYFDHYTSRTKVKIHFKHTGVRGIRFPQETETAMYRVVQEALTNIARHSGGNRATVRLRHEQGKLEVTIRDRGAGFDMDAVEQKKDTGGLAGMKERAHLLNGHLRVDSAPGRGTRILARFPTADKDSPA